MTVGTPGSMSDRAALRAEFVARSGWGDAREGLLAGDASFRKYFRLSRASGTAVVMDSPASHEPVGPFVYIGRHLRELGLSAPEILAEDLSNGFLLLEDLGDETFARVLADGGEERELYLRATDVLVAVHRAPRHGLVPGLDAYKGEALIEAALLLPQWYLPAAAGRAVAEDDIASYRAAWRRCLVHLPATDDALLLRDYQDRKSVV